MLKGLYASLGSSEEDSDDVLRNAHHSSLIEMLKQVCLAQWHNRLKSSVHFWVCSGCYIRLPSF